MITLVSAGDNFTPFRRLSPEKALYEESKEAQLKAAIEASLQEVAKAEPSATHNISNDADDSDLETFVDSDPEDKLNAVPKESTSYQKSTPPPTPTKEPKVVEDYRLYLGPENGSKVELIIRYPDGNRENITFPSDSQLKVCI